jgi:cytidine deaminase
LDVSRLLLMAEQARQHAYAPYSGFHVGAALLTADNRIFTGCNVENSSYGLTVCAERAAVFNAVSAGKKDFLALAVISDGEGYCRPCGACRQVIREFGSDIQIIMASKYRQYEIKKISELLPEGFEF